MNNNDINLKNQIDDCGTAQYVEYANQMYADQICPDCGYRPGERSSEGETKQCAVEKEFHTQDYSVGYDGCDENTKSCTDTMISKFKFEIEMEDFPCKYIERISRPEICNIESTLKSGNTVATLTFNPMRIMLNAPIDSDCIKDIMKWTNNPIKKTLKMKISDNTDGISKIHEEWSITGVQIQSIRFSEISKDDSSIQIETSVGYERAELI